MKRHLLKTRNILFIFSVLLFLTLFVFAIRPLPKATSNNCIIHSGIVAKVEQGDGKGDIIVKLNENKNYFYINRGLDNGLLIEDVKEKLLHKKIDIYTIRDWTPLDSISRTKHVAKLAVDGVLIYSEM